MRLSDRVTLTMDLPAMERAARRGAAPVLYRAGENALGVITARTPSRTGTLRRSLRHVSQSSADGAVEVIVTPLRYAWPVNSGRSRAVGSDGRNRGTTTATRFITTPVGTLV